MNTRMISLIAALAVSASAFAQEAGSAYALPFTRIDHNPVSAAMGGAGMLSTSSLAWSSFSNTAAVPFSELKGDAAASYQMWQPDGSTWYSAGAAFNIKQKFGISLGATMSSSDAIDLVNEEGIPEGSFTPKELQANLGFSYRFVKWVALGANLRFAKQDVAPGSSVSAPAADVFIMGNYLGIKAAAGISNIGGKVKGTNGEVYPLASSATIAVGYGKAFGMHEIEAEAKADFYLSSGDFKVSDPANVSAGIAYTFNKMVAVRAGYHFGAAGSPMPSYATVGAGFCFAGVHIDAAYMLASGDSPLANSLCAGLGFKF